jgi:hypothetical protein
MGKAKFLILSLLTVLFSGCMSPVEESFMHTLSYRVTVEFGDIVGDAVIPAEVDVVKNVTVIVPFPFLDGNPMDLQNMSVPENWKAEIVETSYGKMLKLSGENVKTWEMRPMPVPAEPGKTPTVTPQMVKRAALYEFESRLRLNREVNTINPLDGEYVLQPKLDLKDEACSEDYVKHFRNARCYVYKTMVFYDSEPRVNARVVVWLEGRNEWFQMGWTGNEFDDYLIFVHLTQGGWQSFTGKLDAGKGVYR